MKPHTVIAVAIALSFAACSRGPLVTVKNESGRELQNVVLSGSGFSERLPTLPPAVQHSFSPHVRGESGIRVQFDTAGQHYDSSEEGYFEASGGYRVSVVVSPDMKVAVDSR